MLNRRSFTKSLMAVGGGLFLPLSPTIEAASKPLVCHGLNSVGITTTFNLEQVFQQGQLALMDINELDLPTINVIIDAQIDDSQNSMKVELEGTNKTWVQLPKDYPMPTDMVIYYPEPMGGLDNKQVIYYEATGISVKHSDTEEICPIKDIQPGEFYDLDIFIQGEPTVDTSNKYSVRLERFTLCQ